MGEVEGKVEEEVEGSWKGGMIEAMSLLGSCHDERENPAPAFLFGGIRTASLDSHSIDGRREPSSPSLGSCRLKRVASVRADGLAVLVSSIKHPSLPYTSTAVGQKDQCFGRMQVR